MEQGPLRPPVAHPLGDLHRLPRHRIEAGVVHAGGDVERAGDEVLHLIGLVAVLLEEHRQFDHLGDVAAGVAGDEIGNGVLLLADASTRLAESLVELHEIVRPGLLHEVEDLGVDMLGGDLEMAPDMVGGEFLKVGGIPSGEIHPDTGGDEHPLHPRHVAGLAHQGAEGAVVSAEEFADGGMDAREPAALRLHLRTRTAHLVHVRGRPADVGDRPLEAGLLREEADLGEDRLLRAALDDPSLVGRDRAERAAAETAAHDLDAVLDDFERRDPRGAVGRMGQPGEGESVDAVHLPLLQWQGGRVDDDRLPAIPLHEPSGVVRVGLEVGNPGHCAEGDRVGGHGLERGKLEGVGRGRRGLAGAESVGDAAEITQIADGFAGPEATGDVQDRPLPHAEDDKVGLGIEKDRTPDRVAPVVVVGQPAQRGLHAPGHHRHAGEGLARPLAVGEGGPVGTAADASVGGVGIVVANLPVGGVVVDHRVHVARRDPEEQPRTAELAPRLAAAPVGLREHGHAQPCRLEEAADEAVGKTRVIDVGIPCHEQDINRIPAPLLHLRPAHRQRRRDRLAREGTAGRGKGEWKGGRVAEGIGGGHGYGGPSWRNRHHTEWRC